MADGASPGGDLLPPDIRRQVDDALERAAALPQHRAQIEAWRDRLTEVVAKLDDVLAVMERSPER